MDSAVRDGNVDEVRKLLPSTPKEQYHKWLLNAAWNQKGSVAAIFVDAGANVDATDSYGWTALMEAVYGCDVTLATLLISKGCNVNAQSTREKTGTGYKMEIGTTALHLAVGKSFSDLTELLLSNGAYVDARSEYGTPLHLVLYFNADTRMLNLLLQAGADPSLENRDGETAYTQASAKPKPGLDLDAMLLEGSVELLYTWTLAVMLIRER